MKATTIVLISMVLTLPLSLKGQDFYSRYKEAQKNEREAYSTELQKMRELLQSSNPLRMKEYKKLENERRTKEYEKYITRYEGQKLYFVIDGSNKINTYYWINDSDTQNGINFKPVFNDTFIIQIDTSLVVNPQSPYYVCTEVQKEPLKLCLLEDKKVIVATASFIDNGEDILKITTDVGTITKKIPTSVITDAMLDEILPEINSEYQKKKAAHIAAEAERIRVEAERKAREEAEQLRIAAERKAAEERAEDERKKTEYEREQARLSAIEQTKERIAFYSNHYKLKIQQLRHYHGVMTWPQWLGNLIDSDHIRDIKGDYYYYENDDDLRVPHGLFTVSYFYHGYDYEIKGSFNHGYREGSWTIKAKDRSGKYVTDNLCQFQYKNGVLDGKFVFKTPIISSFSDAVSCSFVNGIVSGTVTIRSFLVDIWAYRTLQGNVNVKGNPHGLWKESYVYPKNDGIPREVTRLYYDGCLVYRRETDLSTGDISYTYQVSDIIKKPSDISIIRNVGIYYVDIGGVKYPIIKSSLDKYHLPMPGILFILCPDIHRWNVMFGPVGAEGGF